MFPVESGIVLETEDLKRKFRYVPFIAAPFVQQIFGVRRDERIFRGEIQFRRDQIQNPIQRIGIDSLIVRHVYQEIEQLPSPNRTGHY